MDTYVYSLHTLRVREEAHVHMDSDDRADHGWRCWLLLLKVYEVRDRQHCWLEGSGEGLVRWTRAIGKCSGVNSTTAAVVQSRS